MCITVFGVVEELQLLKYHSLLSIHAESHLSLPHALLSREGVRFVSISNGIFYTSLSLTLHL